MAAPTFPHAYLSKPVSDAAKAKKRARGLCQHWCCKRVARPGRSDCETCCSRKVRLRDPQMYAYKNLKASASKRGIGFELTFQEFKDFVATTGYVENRGKEPHSLSIDRIRNHEPYRIGNLRVLRYDLNVSHKIEGLEAVTADTGEDPY